MNQNIKKQAVDFGLKMCDTVIKDYTAEELPGPKGRFNYIQGVFLLGMQRFYNICRKPEYQRYIKAWADFMIDSDGNIKEQQPLLDDFMPAVLLIPLYNQTGDKRYKKALDDTISRLRSWHKNRCGGFYHKEITPDQMWLDGLFMAGILLCTYAAEFDAPEFFEEMHTQAMLMYKNIRDEKTGLYYHAWDAEKTEPWANPETGASPVFWGRAMGWVAVALCEMLDYFPKENPGRGDLEKMLSELLESAAEYQDRESGLWYQVVNEPQNPENWRETSCSCLFAYAYKKAARLGYVRASFEENAVRAFTGIIKRLRIEDERLIIPEISVGTNVAPDRDYYLNRPRCENDNHGTGTFLLMCSEFAL